MENKNMTTIIPKGSDVLPTGSKQSSPLTSWASTPPSVTTSSKPNTLSNTLSKPSPLLAASPLIASPLLAASPQSKLSIFKYTLLIIFLIFLILTLVLYIIKPDSTKITDIYAPLITFFSKKKETPITKLEDTVNDKINVDKADNTGNTDNTGNVDNTGKDEEVIELAPVSNDTDDPIQSHSKAKSGSCYIGTDKGFRNCVSVGEGDKCMSGEIFPTLDMCINPKLRE